MIYKINIKSRNILDSDLIADLQRVANKYNKDSLTYSEYDVYGKYDSSTIRRRFGSWKLALSKANLKYTRKNCKKHECCTSDEDFINDVKELAISLNKNTVTYGDYQRYGKYAINKISKRLGGWDNVLQLASLESTPHKLGNGKTITDKELLKEVELMWIELGRQPTTNDVKNRVSKYSLNTYIRRFGSWNNTLIEFVRFINCDKESSEENIELTNSNRLENVIVHKTRREPSNRLKVQVLMRDGNRCKLCGIECNDGLHNIHFDHIVPWSKGGETTLDNLQVLCSDCNLAKGNID